MIPNGFPRWARQRRNIKAIRESVRHYSAVGLDETVKRRVSLGMKVAVLWALGSPAQENTLVAEPLLADAGESKMVREAVKDLFEFDQRQPQGFPHLDDESGETLTTEVCESKSIADEVDVVSGAFDPCHQGL